MSATKLLDPHEDTTFASPSNQQQPPDGRTAVLILDRDGSLHQYDPPHPHDTYEQASIDLRQEQAEPSVIERVLNFTFDILGLNKLEVRVYERSQR